MCIHPASVSDGDSLTTTENQGREVEKGQSLPSSRSLEASVWTD